MNKSFFPDLFSPIQIGSMSVRNRISMPAMHLNYTQDGMVNDRLIEFYCTRARGGAGLIITGPSRVDDAGGSFDMMGLDDDRYIPGLKRLTDALRSEGTSSSIQMYHAGRYIHPFMTGGKEPIAPSPIPSRLFGSETPREMTREDIENVKRSFAGAAARAQAAGFDSVQISASTGYLLCQFLSPVTNQRQDEYGGSFENRVRFPQEVIEAVRQAVGPDFPVLVRVAGSDFVPDSLTNSEVQKVCEVYERAGASALDVTGGWHETRIPQITMNVPRGAFVYLARGIRDRVGIPVIATNRINNPELAEKLLRIGAADMINMARALIADPDLPRKARAGQTDKIRPCIACNQGCFDAVFENISVACLANPRAGRELEFPPIPPKTEQQKKVLVIGGGPGGMEVAATAAERGHSVTLWESRDRLGGQLDLCATPPGRQEFNRLVPYFLSRLSDARVQIELNRQANVPDIRSFSPDVIIVATGGIPIIPPFPGLEKHHVCYAHQVLRGEMWPRGRVVVIGGGATGCETAHWLAEADTIDAETLKFLFVHRAESPEVLLQLAAQSRRPITILEMLPHLGQDISRSTRWTIIESLRRLRIRMKTDTKVKEITDTGVLAERNGREEDFPADSVIIAIGARSNDTIFKELEAQGGYELYRIGDAASPRKVMNAISEGYETAIKI